jgi:3-dehydroquinate synthase
MASTLQEAPARQQAAQSAQVDVDLGDRSYPIYIGAGLLDQAELLQQHVRGRRTLVVTNETIAPLYLQRCKEVLSLGGQQQVDEVVLPDGEEFKSMDVIAKIWDRALELRLDRKSVFVALGGGVIGDMTGFAAAAYQRGVSFVQVPTTVMAQVDSSVGGKTGVNHPLGKNMIGAFHQPDCVLIDIATLDSLPDRELASGISEIIKYGLIRDASFFEWLEANMGRLLARDREAFTYAIERSCINKAEVVAADEREGGVRATLNLGHTFGHAIENVAGYGAWLHGEAVSAGTVMAADLSHRLGWIDKSLYERAQKLLELANLPVVPPEGMTKEQFMTAMSVDKKVENGKLRLVLLKGPLGGCIVTDKFSLKALDETLSAFCPS